MRIDIACFTDRGEALGARLERELAAGGDRARLRRCGAALPVRRWVAERFRGTDALVFIGAVGLAVRAVAPEVADKTCDPAVVAVDDAGRFAVSILSGHIGGANALAERIARLIGATPVVTTATDAAGVFAVDAWAARRGLAIVNPERIKAVSAALLAGRPVTMRSPFPVAGALPAGVVLAEGDCDIVVDCRAPAEARALHLVPRVAALGVGCRKGTPAEAIHRAFRALCESAGLSPRSFAKVCSIDRKRDEPGLVAFCAELGLPFETFDAETLAGVAGEFNGSGFVAAVAGVDNVCERSAVLGSGGGGLAAGKSVAGGVTMAAALAAYRLDFGMEGGDGA